MEMLGPQAALPLRYLRKKAHLPEVLDLWRVKQGHLIQPRLMRNNERKGPADKPCARAWRSEGATF